MFVCCECRVLSGRGLCDELITRPEESHRLWCVVVCDLENLENEEAMTRVGSQRHRKKKVFLLTCVLCSVYSWHSPATLTEVFPCFFLSCKANSHKDGARSAPFLISELCFSMYCLCVNVYCTTATGWQPNYIYIYLINLKDHYGVRNSPH